jgi:amino-acid N-acetyltransferase
MNLKSLRLSRNLTIQKLGTLLKIDGGNLSKIEQGKIKPSVTILEKYADYFNLSVDQLLGRNNLDYISYFRAATPYIHEYQKKIFVIAFDGFAIDSKNFSNLSTDINLLHALGIKIVLVHGIRPFIDNRLKNLNMKSIFNYNQRITTEPMLQHVIEINGFVKTKIEAALSSNIYKDSIIKSELKISSGNFLMAKPQGIINGTDMKHTGEIREINNEDILKKLDQDEIVLASPIGYSPIGDIFNLSYENVACEIAIAINAEKLIYCTEDNGIQNLDGDFLSEITLPMIKDLSKKIKKIKQPEFIKKNTQVLIDSSIKGLDGGLKKIHLINRHVNGALISELFTNSGQGSVITNAQIEKFRQASIEDAKIIEKLIKPLADNQILVERSLNEIEENINSFYILEFDKKIIGCAKIDSYKKLCEIASFAINENYRNMGYGEKLLSYCEHKCQTKGSEKIFVLTTQSEHWFIENGYKEVTIDKLPIEKLKKYSMDRKSRVLIKHMET